MEATEGPLGDGARVNRSEILTALAGLPADADGGSFDPMRHYLPVPLHNNLGNRDVWLVVGARGMGKTTLFRTLTDQRQCMPLVGPLFASSHVQAVDGWSGTGQHHNPDPMSVTDSRAYWLATLVHALDGVNRSFGTGTGISSTSKNRRVSQILENVRRDREQVVHGVFEVDERLAQQNARILVAYDALERLPAWEALVPELLAFWSDLAPRLRTISPKIFVREDVRDRLIGRGPDFAKLNGRTLTLAWTPHDLFRLLAFLLANSSEVTREWLEKEGGFAFLPPSAERTSYLPNPLLAEEGVGSQDRLAELLAGRVMGAGAQKGLTRRWIPKTLADGRGAIAPRSATWLLRGAAQAALGAPRTEGALFTPDELRDGMRAAAKNRADELREERADVVELLKRLTNHFVPLGEADLAFRLFTEEGKVSLKDEEPGVALAELERLGVVMRRSDGRFDVPDLYRLGFGIKRKGGTALTAPRR